MQNIKCRLGLMLSQEEIVGWFSLGKVVVSFWLFWIVIYEVTGGDVLGKMNKRAGGWFRGKKRG
jgi:hypothetical protein